MSPLAPLGCDRYFVNFQITSLCGGSMFRERQQSWPRPPLLLSLDVLLERQVVCHNTTLFLSISVLGTAHVLGVGSSIQLF